MSDNHKGIPIGMSIEEFEEIVKWMEEGCKHCGVKPRNMDICAKYHLTPSTVSRIRHDHYRPDKNHD